MTFEQFFNECMDDPDVLSIILQNVGDLKTEEIENAFDLLKDTEHFDYFNIKDKSESVFYAARRLKDVKGR